MSKTIVIFRVFKDGGDVLALFPYEDDGVGRCMSYMHVGQHGGADYAHCIAATRPATPEEYAPLHRELTRIGYDLEVKQRANRWRHRLTNDDMRDNAANTYHSQRQRAKE